MSPERTLVVRAERGDCWHFVGEGRLTASRSEGVQWIERRAMAEGGAEKRARGRDALGRFLPGQSGNPAGRQRQRRRSREEQLTNLRERLGKEMDGLSIGEAVRVEKMLRGLEAEAEAEAEAEEAGAGEEQAAEMAEAGEETSERRRAALRVLEERREGADED